MTKVGLANDSFAVSFKYCLSFRLAACLSSLFQETHCMLKSYWKES